MVLTFVLWPNLYLPNNGGTNAVKVKQSAISKLLGSDSNLLIVFYVQIMPDDLVMQLHRF